MHLMDGRLVIEVAKGAEGESIGLSGIGIKDGEGEDREDDEEEVVSNSLGYSDPNVALQAHLARTCVCPFLIA